MNLSSRKFDINTTSVNDLIKLPQVGPGLAQEIIANRPYQHIAELKSVSGIGDKLYLVLKKYLKVSSFDIGSNLGVDAVQKDVSRERLGKLDINKASIEQLQAVPGIGQVLADTIVSGRPYSNLGDLQRINGVGNKVYQGLRKYLKVSKKIEDTFSEETSTTYKKLQNDTQHELNEIPVMPEFDEEDDLDLVSSHPVDANSSVEVETIRELIGPPIVDRESMIDSSDEINSEFSEPVKVFDTRSRYNWQPVDISIKPYRRRRPLRFVIAVVLAGLILGVFQTVGFLGPINVGASYVIDMFTSMRSDVENIFGEIVESTLDVSTPNIATDVSDAVFETITVGDVLVSTTEMEVDVVTPEPVEVIVDEGKNSDADDMFNSTEEFNLAETQVVTLVTKIETSTVTPMPTNTVTPTMVPTISIPDSVFNLDLELLEPLEVMWEERFYPLSFDSWGWNETENWYSGIEDGMFKLITKGRNKQFYSSAPELNLFERNFYYEGDVIVDACIGKDYYGLLFKASLEIDEYFAATITCEGNYRLINKVNGIYNDLRIAVSDVITSGDGVYRLGVLVNGDSFSLYVNGALVHEYIWTGLGELSAGEFGVYARSVESDELRVNWDNLIATELKR